MSRALELLPLAALIWIGAVGLGRAAMMYRRGVQVVVIDRQRTLGEQAFDLTVVLTVAAWAYLVVAYARPPGPAWLPGLLQIQLPLPAPIKAFGAALLLLGTAIYAIAVIQMGASWRMGIDRTGRPRADSAVNAHAEPQAATASSPDPSISTGNAEPRRAGAPLVTSGIFAWSRNPIYLAFDLVVDGAFVAQGRLSLLLLAILLTVLLHFQVLREEKFLACAYGQQYAEYQRSVGRYGPWNRWFEFQ